MIRGFVLKIIVSGVALWAADYFLAGFAVTGGLWGYAAAGLALGALNTFVRPLLKILTFPLILITFGLFSAIINAPESCILSIGAARERAVVREGRVVPRTTAYLGINADHRIVDGAPAAEFLATLRDMLEHAKVMPA